MKEFFSEIRGAIMATLVLAVVCCGLYPLVVFGLAQALFHDKANGSLIVDNDGTVRGSKLLGQGFTDPKYFHPRPLPPATATTPPAPAAAISGRPRKSCRRDQGSRRRLSQGKWSDGKRSPCRPMPSPLPAAASTRTSVFVTPSCKSRVAKARGLSEEKVRELVQQNTIIAISASSAIQV